MLLLINFATYLHFFFKLYLDSRIKFENWKKKLFNIGSESIDVLGYLGYFQQYLIHIDVMDGK